MTDTLYIPQHKVRELEYVDKDDPDGIAFKAVVRANLTFGERNTLIFEDGNDTTMAQVHAALAPYVMSWNVGRINEKGKPEPVPAPKDGGAESFAFIPNTFFWFLWTQIRDYAIQRLDPTPSVAAEASDEPSDDTSMDET